MTLLVIDLPAKRGEEKKATQGPDKKTYVPWKQQIRQRTNQTRRQNPDKKTTYYVWYAAKISSAPTSSILIHSAHLENDEQTALDEGVADSRHALSVQHEHVIMLRHLHNKITEENENTAPHSANGVFVCQKQAIARCRPAHQSAVTNAIYLPPTVSRHSVPGPGQSKTKRSIFATITTRNILPNKDAIS